MSSLNSARIIALISVILTLMMVSTAHAKNDTIQFCSDNYGYCITLTNPNTAIDFKQNNDGSFGLVLKDYKTKAVVAATKYDADITPEFLKNNLFQGWRETDFEKKWVTRSDFEKDNTATFLYTYLDNQTLMTAHRFVKYDEQNGYIELYTKYPNQYEKIIQPMLEEMEQSITLKQP